MHVARIMRSIVDFLFNESLDIQPLLERWRLGEYPRETFTSVSDTCKQMVNEVFAPSSRIIDSGEPSFDGERLKLPRQAHDPLAAYVGSAIVASTRDEAAGGMQPPRDFDMAAKALFYKASLAVNSYPVLTPANANLLMPDGTPRRRRFDAF